MGSVHHVCTRVDNESAQHHAAGQVAISKCRALPGKCSVIGASCKASRMSTYHACGCQRCPGGKATRTGYHLLSWTCICACTCCTLFFPYPLKRSSEGTECCRDVIVHGSNSLRCDSDLSAPMHT